MRVAWMLLLSAGLAAGDGATALHREDGDQRTRTSDDASRDVASPITAPTTQRSTAPNTGAVPMRTATPASGPPATGLTPSDPLQPRDLSPQQLQTLVAVAADVSPEWGAILSSRIKSDPEGVKRAILKSGRRLLALAVLRDQNPELYRLKVDELRMQDQMNALAKRYREAVAAGRESEAESWRKQLAEKVREQVDLDLKTRAEELAALDRHVRELKDKLAEDAARRPERIRDLLESFTGQSMTGSVGPGTRGEPKPGEAAAATTTAASAPTNRDG